jgi:cytochrome c peroxidase
MSETKFQLGRRLFYDKRLSGNGSMSCSSCYLQQLAFTDDGKAVSRGSTGDLTPRSAMSIVNVAYYPTLTWAKHGDKPFALTKQYLGSFPPQSLRVCELPLRNRP